MAPEAPAGERQALDIEKDEYETALACVLSRRQSEALVGPIQVLDAVDGEVGRRTFKFLDARRVDVVPVPGSGGRGRVRGQTLSLLRSDPKGKETLTAWQRRR